MKKIGRGLLSNDLLQFFLLLIIFIIVEGITTGGDYFYSHSGWADHWLYLGHFENSTLFNPTHIWNYKSSRLVWIWQGGLIFKYLPYPYSNYLIVIYSLSKYWTIFWLVVRQFTTNKANALFYVSILMFYPTFSRNGGWYYHNFEASSWWLLSIYLLKLIESERISEKYIIISGIFAGLAINTNLFFVNFLPMFFLLNPNLFYRKKYLIAYALLGSLSTFPILGLINVLLGGKFEYYLPMFKMITVFKGAPELWKPFLHTESVKLLFLTALIALAFVILKLIEFKKNKKNEYMPICSITFFTMGVYIYWHIRGVEVLSVDVHNSMLLMTSFLLLIDFGENFFKDNIPIYSIVYLFGLTWFSVHYLYNPSQVLTYFFQTNAYNEVIIVSLIFILIVVSLFMGRTILWFISLCLLPYLLTTHRIYPNFLWNKNRCLGQREHDIVFDVKQEMQKISSPMLLRIQGSSAIASAIDLIGMHNSWPQQKYFSEDCHFSIFDSKILKASTDYHFLAIIKNSNHEMDKDELRCKKWALFERPVFKKEYRNCEGENVEFSILSDK
jgi:hypothetical protein